MEPIIWLGVLAVLLVIEGLTTALTTIWFAGGALVAAIASGAGAGILVQWILFLVISLVLLIFTRPLAVRYMNKGVPKTGSSEAYEKRHRENKCGRSSWKKGCRDPEDQ